MSGIHALILLTGRPQGTDQQPLFGHRREDLRAHLGQLMRPLSLGLPSEIDWSGQRASEWGEGGLEKLKEHAQIAFGATYNHLEAGCDKHRDMFGVSREPLLGGAHLRANAIHSNVEDAASASRKITRGILPRLAVSIALQAMRMTGMDRPGWTDHLRRAIDKDAADRRIDLPSVISDSLRKGGLDGALAARLGEALHAQVRQTSEKMFNRALVDDGCSGQHPGIPVKLVSKEPGARIEEVLQAIGHADPELRGQIEAFLSAFSKATDKILKALEKVHLMNQDYALGLADLCALGTAQEATGRQVETLMHDAIRAERESESELVYRRLMAARKPEPGTVAFTNALTALEALNASGSVRQRIAQIEQFIQSNPVGDHLLSAVRSIKNFAVDKGMAAAQFANDHSTTATIIYLMGVMCTAASLNGGQSLVSLLQDDGHAAVETWARTAARLDAFANATGESFGEKMIQALSLITNRTAAIEQGLSREGAQAALRALVGNSSQPADVTARLVEFVDHSTASLANYAKRGAQLTSFMASVCYVLSGLSVIKMGQQARDQVQNAETLHGLIPLARPDGLSSVKPVLTALCQLSKAPGDTSPVALLDSAVGRAASELEVALRDDDRERIAPLSRSLTITASVRLAVNLAFEWNDALGDSIEARSLMTAVVLPLAVTAVLESRAKHLTGAHAFGAEKHAEMMDALRLGKPLEPQVLVTMINTLVQELGGTEGEGENAQLARELQGLKSGLAAAQAQPASTVKSVGHALEKGALVSAAAYIAYMLLFNAGVYPWMCTAGEQADPARAGHVISTSPHAYDNAADLSMPRAESWLYHSRDLAAGHPELSWAGAAAPFLGLARSVAVALAIRAAAATGALLHGIGMRQERGQIHALRAKELGAFVAEITRHLGAGMVANALAEGPGYAYRSAGTMLDTLMTVVPDLLVMPAFVKEGSQQEGTTSRLLAHYQHAVLAQLPLENMRSREIVSAMRCTAQRLAEFDLAQLRVLKSVLNGEQTSQVRDATLMFESPDFARGILKLYGLYMDISVKGKPASAEQLERISEAQRAIGELAMSEAMRNDGLLRAIHGPEPETLSVDEQQRLDRLGIELRSGLAGGLARRGSDSDDVEAAGAAGGIMGTLDAADLQLVRKAAARLAWESYSPQAMAHELLRNSHGDELQQRRETVLH